MHLLFLNLLAYKEHPFREEYTPSKGCSYLIIIHCLCTGSFKNSYPNSNVLFWLSLPKLTDRCCNSMSVMIIRFRYATGENQLCYALFYGIHVGNQIQYLIRVAPFVVGYFSTSHFACCPLNATISIHIL